VNLLKLSVERRRNTMKHFGKFVLLALAFGGADGVAPAMMLAAPPPPVTCRPVHCTIHSVFTTQRYRLAGAEPKRDH
jgi:hypothetical protein